MQKQEQQQQEQQQEQEQESLAGLFEEPENKDPRKTAEQIDQIKLTDKQIVSELYKLADQLEKGLSNIGVHYWTSGGTTLGIIRHAALIPWDDDLDICIMDHHQQLLLDNQHKLQHQYGLILVPNKSFGYRIYIQHSTRFIDSGECGYPFCDVFVMQQYKNKWIIKGEGARIWPLEKYSCSDVQMWQYMTFGDVQLKVAGNPEKYLDKYYGNDWRYVGKTHNYDHIREQYVQSTRFDLDWYHDQSTS